MTERIVDAAFSDLVGAATFFLTDHYVEYDYAADRVRDALHPVSSFPPGNPTGFPAGFPPAGPDGRIDAALTGRRGSAGSVYFFRGQEYVRFDVGVGFQTPRLITDAWGLPADFATPAAAWNGFGNRDPFCYFFQDSRYARYLWDTDQTDEGYPKPTTNMVNYPADFGAIEPDAAVDGAGPFANNGYVFTGSDYLRFRWVEDGEPFADGTARIVDGWTGLAEMLMACKALSNSLVWLAEAQDLLASQLAGATTAQQDALLTEALAAHFKTTPADTASITAIAGQYAQLTAILTTPTTFRYRTDAEVVAEVPTFSPPPAAFATFGGHVTITSTFPARAELNRISVMLHEAIHVIDGTSGTSDVHISEWYVTDAEADRLGLAHTADQADFATRYDLMTTAQSLHNPSAYATFARHVHFGFDSREIA